MDFSVLIYLVNTTRCVVITQSRAAAQLTSVVNSYGESRVGSVVPRNVALINYRSRRAASQVLYGTRNTAFSLQLSVRDRVPLAISSYVSVTTTRRYFPRRISRAITSFEAGIKMIRNRNRTLSSRLRGTEYSPRIYFVPCKIDISWRRIGPCFRRRIASWLFLRGHFIHREIPNAILFYVNNYPRG